MTQNLNSCAIIKDSASELLDLSMLFPVAPWVSHVTCCQRDADDSESQFMCNLKDCTSELLDLALLFPAASWVCMFTLSLAMVFSSLSTSSRGLAGKDYKPA